MIYCLLWFLSLLASEGGYHAARTVYKGNVNLLDAVTVLTDTRTKMVDGPDGFPVVELQPGSDNKLPQRMLLPDKLDAEFAIRIAARLDSLKGGFVFAIVNPLETVVQLGVRLEPTSEQSMNVNLYYTDPKLSVSQMIASFTVPFKLRRYFEFLIRVKKEEVVLASCKKSQEIRVNRVPMELVFDSASTLYIGQAGPIINSPFQVKFTTS